MKKSGKDTGENKKALRISDDKIDMLEDIGMFWEDLKNAKWDWFVGLLRECIRTTKKPFVIDRNYRYKNYALGEKVREVIQQYANGSLSAEQERDIRKAGFKFNIYQIRETLLLMEKCGTHGNSD